MSSSPSWSPSTVKGAGAAIGRGGPGPGPGPGPTPTAGTTAVPNAPAGNLTPQPQSISSSQAQTTAFISSQAASTASASASAAPSHYNHHHHHYTTTDPSASASASASTFPFSSSSSSSSSSPAPAALAFFPQQTGAYRQQQQQQQQQQRASSPPTAFTPQGNTSFASFLTPHQESESDSAFSAVLTRPRAGTLPSNVYADDFNPVADSSSTAYPSPLGYSNSSDDRYGAQQGISSLSPPLSHPSLLHSAAAAAAAAAPGTTRVPRRQTFYTGTGTGTPSREGSSSASLVSSSTFQSFYPLIGSLSASASRPSSSAGHASFGLDHSSNAPTTASRTRAASSLIPSSLSLSSVNIHSDGSGGYSSQQQGAPAGSTTHFFPGRVRGHTTGVAVGSSSSSPSISDSAGTSPNLNSGTQPSSSSSFSAAAAAAAAATAAAGLFIRHPSPLGPGLGIGSSSPSHITSTSASVRPSSPPSLTRGVIGRGIASTAPNSTLHSPTLGLNGNGGGPANLTISGASAAGGFFGRDGLFGANTPISGSAGIPSSPSTGAGAGATNGSNVVRSTSSSHGPPLGRTRARPSTSSAASPFLNTRVESGAGSPSTPSGWNSLSTAGTTLFGVDIGGSYLNKNNNNGNGTSSARSTMPPSTSSGADDFYMHQTEEAMVGRVGGGASAGLRTASSGAHQLSQQQQLSDPYEHHQHERANMRSRALTLAHPNPHSHPHPLLLHGGLGHAVGDGGASSSYGIAAQEDGGMGGLGYGSMLDAAQQQQQQQQQQVGSSYSINEQEDGARIGQQQQQGVGGAGPNRPRAISTGAPPPFFSREGRTPVFGPGGMGLGNGTPAGGAGGGGGAFFMDSLAFGGSPRLEGSESLLYNNNHNANNTNSGVVSQQQAPNPTSTSTLSSYDNVATPTLSENAAARILRDYALEHGLNPSRFVQAAADMGLGVNLPVHHHLQQHHAHHHGNVWGPSAGAAGGGAGVGGGNNVLMEMRGVGVRPSVSFQEPENGHNSGSSNAALSSLLSTLASNPAAAGSGSGSGAGGRPSLTHTQSTPVVPPTSLGRTQLSSNQDRLLGARDDLAASPTGTAPSAHDQLLSLVAGSSSLSSASPRARAATASFAGGAFGNGGGGGGGGGGGMGDSLTMALAAHMASAAAEERDRERGHALGGQQGQGQTYGLGSSAVLESGDPSAAQAGPGGELESSYGSSSGLAPLANRFRSGTMAAGAPSGFVGLGAGGVGRLRAEQELMRMAAIIKATQALQASGNGSGNGGAHAGSGGATSAGTGTQGSSAATTAVNRSTDSAGGRSVSSRGGSQRPQTADSGALHRAQQQQQQQQPELSAAAASEALAGALHATGEAGMSLLPPPAASRSGSSFVTRASRSNSNASAQSGLTPSPTTGPNTPGGGSGFFGGHHHSQARPRAATTAALSQGGWLGSGANNVNIGGGAFSGHVTPVSGEPSTGAGAGGGRQHLHSHGATATSNQQTPTRSLWIGNLDSSVTGQELTRAFAPYGAVESVRLLPEKECGFVNFIDLDDAVRAREDVLVRLGGRLALVETPLAPSGQPRTGGTGANGQVRIGYGKVDSAPGVAQPPLGTGGDGAAANGANFGDAVPDGFGAENTQPTRALWIGSIPNTTTQADLLNIFQPFGPVESVRVLTHKNCGFINFERVDDAMLARTALHSRDFLGAENGVIRIGFAKVPTRNTEEFTMVDEADVAAGGMPAYPQATIDALSQLQGANGISGEQQLNSGYIENYRSNLIVNLLQNQVSQQAQSQSQSQSQSQPQPQPQQQPQQQQQPPQLQQQQPPSTPQEAFVPTAAMGTVPAPQGGSAVAPSNEKGGVTLPPHLQPQYSVSDLQLLMHELGENEPAGQARTDVLAAAEARPLATYYSSIPLVAEVCKNRRFDPNRLREIRRLMDSPNFSTAEVDNLAQEYMKDIVDLAADYIGNTAVQKFFERASENCKYMMLEELAPHLAMIGIHKNGTWSAQKIIESCRRPDQVELISKHLRPYVPPLMLDQFGNYVVQCVLPFCSPASDFVFDAMVDRIWEVAQGRFGARSMRACLENNNHVTRRQIKRVACAIILHAVPLSTNANGALLLTWLLDTSNLAARYRLLAPRFAPHLAQLCTHKLSHITIWRLVSQNKDMSASRLILDTLFGKAGAGERDDDNAASERARGSKEISPLEEIVVDQLHGSGFIAKVLASPVVEAMKTDGRPDKPRYVAQVRKLLVRNRLVGMPAYRRLLEEVGLAETLPAAVAPPPQALAPGPPPPLLHGLTSPPPFGMMAGGLPPGVGLPHPHSHLPPPPPPGAPALPEQGMSPPPIPPQLLAAAVAGNHAALQELVHMGFLPPGAVPLPGGAGTGMDPAQLNDMMGQMQLGQQMYGQGGPAPPPFGGAPPGHLGGVGGGGRGQPGMGGPPGHGHGHGHGHAHAHSHGHGHGHGHHNSQSVDFYSMSPEQAVGSGLLSPPPAPRSMGWPAQPAPPQSSFMGSFSPWDTADLPNPGGPFGRPAARTGRGGRPSTSPFAPGPAPRR